MAKKKTEPVVEEVINEIIEPQPLEEVMGDRYATYAKYVIQDRAIPDARDGLKPVQRRIIYSMWKDNNVSTKPTRKCAHTVGAVMGKYHPHGDTSIYEALARMSQDWKVRTPLIDFQGNNGSIDGDSPAAYRYTEARLSEIADEMVRDIEKKTVDMNLTFDDTDFEPDVLPARFPNLLVNGTEGIAVALATEIPPHNLVEVCNAAIYKIEHKNATNEELRQFILGPDFPTGGVIYKSEGLDQIYETGRGKIEVSSKCEIVQNGNLTQIVITEIPYKVVKIQLVYEIDKIRHDKIIDGIADVRDESDIQGLRIVIDLKKDAKAETILAYLMKSTELKTNYTANMVAIVEGRPKTMSLSMMLDAYVNHQIDVITRRSQFDLAKYRHRLHIVDGVVVAIDNYEEVVKIIQHSKDKADSKINLQKAFNLSEEQSEAVVMMPLYKLSHTDVNILLNEKAQLEKDIQYLIEILEDPKKLNRVIINDLKAITKKYGTPRRTLIEDKGEVQTSFSKRDLFTHEDTMLCITRDGYVKRSSFKSYRAANDALPGLKQGDVIAYQGEANTADYVIAFTSKGNYLLIPIYEIPEGKWKDEGKHINFLINFNSSDDKIIKCFVIRKWRSDLYFALITKRGQLKRTRITEFEALKFNRPLTAIKIMKGDELVNVALINGSNNLLIITDTGESTFFSETCLTPVGTKASGVKAISDLKSNNVAALVPFEPDEKGRAILFTDKGDIRIYYMANYALGKRLAKPLALYQNKKSDKHKLVYACKVIDKNVASKFKVLTLEGNIVDIEVSDYTTTNTVFAAKTKLSNLTSKDRIVSFFNYGDAIIDDSIVSKDVYVAPVKPIREELELAGEEEVLNDKSGEKEEFEQISIFDNDDSLE